MSWQKPWAVWLVAAVMACLGSVTCWVVAQSHPETPPALTEKPTHVQGFADVVRSSYADRMKAPSNAGVSKEMLSVQNTKQAWAQLLRSLNFRLPERPEGWRFADYSWRRWRGALASRSGSVRRWRILTMEATAYCPNGCCGSAHGRTATGRRAEYGVVAVDPRVIPLGTALYVDRYGFAIAADTGRLIKGRRIDLCFPTHREASRFGRRRVRVLVLR